MIIIPNKTGEVKVALSEAQPAISFQLSVSVADKYSVWTSAQKGTVRVFSEFDLHLPIAIGTQKLAEHLEPGNYFVALTGDVGNFTINVTSIKPVAAPQKPQAVLEAEAETHAEA